MRFWQGPIIRHLILNVAALAGISILISLAALIVVQSANQSMRQVQMIADAATLSTRIRSECIVLTEMVHAYAEQTPSKPETRSKIVDKQAQLAQLMDQTLAEMDPNNLEQSLQIGSVRQNLFAFSAQASLVLDAYDEEKMLGPITLGQFTLLTEYFQAPLLHALQDFEYSEFKLLENTRSRADQYFGWVIVGMVLTIGLVVGVVGVMVRQVVVRVARPLAELRRGVDLLRAGQLDQEIPVKSQDEVGQLAEALNTMAAEVRMAHEQQENYTRLLETQVSERTQEAEQRANQAALLSELANRRTQELEMLASQAQTAQEISSAASGTLDLEMLLQQSVDLIQDRFQLDHVGLFLLDENQKVASLRAATGEMKKLLQTEVPQLAVDETSLIGWAILHMQYRLAIDVTQVSTRRRHNLLPDTGSELALPLITHGSVIGAISVQTRKLNAFEPAAITIFQTMAAQLSNAIANAKLYQEVEQLAILDSLLGIYNRRHWFELTSREFYRAVRYQKPLSLILLDIDHFKQVNDIHGHPLGDVVLRSLSRICEKNVRTADLVGRYGGEEFLVAMPETNAVEAVQIAERLRLATEEMRVASKNEDVQVTISLGVATLMAEIDTNLDQLVKRADEALYQAKNSGRNRVVLSDPMSGRG